MSSIGMQSDFLIASGVVPDRIEKKDEAVLYIYKDPSQALAQLERLQYFPVLDSATPYGPALKISANTDGESVVCLTKAQHEYFEEIRCGQHLLAKVIRTDNNCFIESFAKSLTHFDDRPREELRAPHPRKAFTVHGAGVFETKQFSPYPVHRHSEKKDLSRHQSTTFLSREVQPQLFHGWDGVAGVLIQENLALINRVLGSDAGTFLRPYDFETREQAEAYHEEMIREKKLFTDIEALKSALKGSTRYNEVLARLHWDLNSSAVGIFSEKLSACGTAILYAQIIRKYAKARAMEKGEPWDDRYQVPLVYYLPGKAKNYRAYTAEAQAADQARVDAILKNPAELQATLAKGKFYFLMLASPENAHKILDIQFKDQPIIIYLIRQGLFPLANGLLERISAVQRGESVAIAGVGAPASSDSASGSSVKEYAEENELPAYLLYLQEYCHKNPSPFRSEDRVLHGAFYQENPEVIIKKLSQLGAKVTLHEKNNFGQSILHIVSELGKTQCFQALVDEGADINQTNTNGKTPLFIAAQNGHLGILHALIAAKADVNKYDRYGQTALHRASQAGHLAVVETLIAAGAVDMYDVNGNTPLYLAVKPGHLAIVQALINAGANVNTSSNDRETIPLLTASKSGHLGIVQALIKAGADLKKYNSDGQTALHFAAKFGHLAIVKELIKAGADLNKHNAYAKTPLFIASQYGHLSVVQALISAGAEVIKNTFSAEYSPLYIAAEDGHLDVVRELIAAGAKIDFVLPPLIKRMFSGLTDHQLVLKLMLMEYFEGSVECLSCPNPRRHDPTRTHRDLVHQLMYLFFLNFEDKKKRGSAFSRKIAEVFVHFGITPKVLSQEIAELKDPILKLKILDKILFKDPKDKSSFAHQCFWRTRFSFRKFVHPKVFKRLTEQRKALLEDFPGLLPHLKRTQMQERALEGSSTARTALLLMGRDPAEPHAGGICGAGAGAGST